MTKTTSQLYADLRCAESAESAAAAAVADERAGAWRTDVLIELLRDAYEARLHTLDIVEQIEANS